MRRHALVLAALPAITALFVAACVGDDATGGSSGTTPQNEAGVTEAGDEQPSTNQPALTLSLGAKTLSILPQKTVTLDATIVRGGGLRGPVKLSTSGLPGGVTAEPVTIAADQD